MGGLLESSVSLLGGLREVGISRLEAIELRLLGEALQRGAS